MKKETFIPQAHLPRVVGARIKECPSVDFESSSLGPETPKAVIIGPADDNVLKFFKRRNFAKVLVLHLDEVLHSWHYRFSNGVLTFFVGDQSIIPLSVYFRGAILDDVSEERRLQLWTFVEVLNAWPGKVTARPRIQGINESKALQQTNTLDQAIKKSRNGRVRTPRTYFIKGCPSLLQNLLRTEKELIVKSASGVRSRVVNHSVFKSWNTENLKSTPVMFQEEIRGHDVRVHVLNRSFYGKTVKEKNGTDYRYVDRSELVDINVPTEVQDFVAQVSDIEKNPLMGVDFVVRSEKGEEKFYCLEANPGPGWAWYHANDRFEPGSFNYELVQSICS